MLSTVTPEPVDDRLFLGRYWKAKSVVLLVILLLIFNVGMNLDKFRTFIGFYWIVIGQPNPKYCCYYWNDFAYQTTDWLMEKLVVYSQFHIASMRFRLLPPLLYTVFSSPLALYSLQVVSGIGYLYMMLDEVYKMLNNRRLALLFAIGYVGLYEGAAFILDVSGFGDPFAFTLMMGAMYFRKPLLVCLCVFLASWVDERAVFNVTLIITYHLLAQHRIDRPLSFDTLAAFRPNKQMLAALAACLAYLAIRLYLTYRFNLTSPTGGDSIFFNVFNAFKTVGFRLWSGYEGFWLLLSAMLFLLWQRRQYLLLFLLVGLTGLTTFTVLMQGDYIRTLSFGFPLLFIALTVVSKEISRRDLFWVLTAIALITLLYPIPY